MRSLSVQELNIILIELRKVAPAYEERRRLSCLVYEELTDVEEIRVNNCQKLEGARRRPVLAEYERPLYRSHSRKAGGSRK